MTHDPLCPNSNGSCCPAVTDCTCQCLCEFITTIRADEREQAARRVAESVRHKRNESIMLTSNPPQMACVCGLVWPHPVVDPVAAARGEGTAE